MKKKLLGLILAVFMMFALAMNAGGEEAKPGAKGEAKPEAKPAISLEEIKNLLGLSIYLQGGYTFTKESIIDQTYSSEISPGPSLPKRGIPPFGKGRGGGI